MLCDPFKRLISSLRQSMVELEGSKEGLVWAIFYDFPFIPDGKTFSQFARKLYVRRIFDPTGEM